MLRLIKRIFILILFTALLVLGGLAYARYVEPFWLATSDMSLSSDTIEIVSSNDLKIAVFSDTHFSNYYSVEDFEETVRELNAAKPDIIFFLGDLIDNFNSYTGNISDISDSLDSLTAPLGKFAVYGNHDYGGGAQMEYESIMEQGGFQVLVNERVFLDEYNLLISGVDDFVIGNGSTEFLADNSAENYNIVLCHEPDIIDQALDYNIDLMLAGHTHGGQIRIPAYEHDFLPSYGKKYLKGRFEFQNPSGTTLYVTSGIGTTKLPLRFLARPEILLITLEK